VVVAGLDVVDLGGYGCASFACVFVDVFAAMAAAA